MNPTETRMAALIAAHFGTEIADFDAPLKTGLFVETPMDSLDVIELVMATEDEFGVEIGDDEAEPYVGEKGRTVREWCLLVDGKLAAAGERVL